VNETNPIKLTFQLLQQQYWYSMGLLFLWLFSIYSEIPLTLSSGKYIPSITLLMLLPLVWPYIKDQFLLKHLTYILLITGIALLSVVTHLAGNDVLSIIIRLLQFGYSIFFSVVTFLFVKCLPIKIVKDIIGFFCVLIVVGCFLERIGILSSVTHAYRAVYGGTNYGGEINAEREILIAGFSRPFFFTSEPSTVGLGFFGFASAFTFLNRKFHLDIIIFILTIAEIMLLGSPTVLLTIVMWVVIVTVKYKINPLKVALGVAVFCFAILTLLNTKFGDSLLGSLASRFSEEILMEGSSMYARIYVPYFVTFPKIISTYPFFGVGFGNNGMLNQIFGFNAAYEGTDLEFYRGANAFVGYVSYMGIVGTVMIIATFLWFHRTNKIPYFLVTILFWFLMCQMMGTYATPKIWCFFSLFMAASYLQKNMALFVKNKQSRLEEMSGISLETS